MVERPSAIVEDCRALEASEDDEDCCDASRVANDSARATYGGYY